MSVLIVALPVLAHDVAKGPHGGRIAEASGYHVELVAKDSLVDVFLTDAADRPVASAGFKGVAILVISGKSIRVVLEPRDGSKLSGRAASAVPSEPKGVIQITEPSGKTAQARFN